MATKENIETVAQDYWNKKVKQAEIWRGIFENSPQALKEYTEFRFPMRELLSFELDEWGGRGAQFILNFKCQGIIPFWFYESDIWALPKYFDGLGIEVNAIAVNGDATCFIGSLGWLNDESGNARHFPDRLTALQAGIQKAFQIREAQLA